MKFLNAIFVLMLIGGTCVFAQNTNAENQKLPRVSEAYVVLVKEKAKLKGNLYEARQSFSPESSEYKSATMRFSLLNREIGKLSRASAQNAAKFSAAYGDLILAKVQTELELYELRQRLTPESIAVRKKQIELQSLNHDLQQINKSFR
jgi:hypothetical protein